MKRSLLFLSVALVLWGFGCTKAVEVPSEPVASESPALSISEITDPNAALTEGKRLLDENRTDLAIEAFNHAVSLNPNLPEAHFQLGIAYSLLEMQQELDGVAPVPESTSKDGRSKTRSEKAFERAIEAYEKWLDENPKDDVGFYNLGRAYAKLMKDEEAEEAFELAVKLKPEDAEYQTELGGIRVKLADYRQAIEPLKKAVELDPYNVRAQELLEDAEAGRQRIDYVSPKKDTNTQPDGNRSTNSNSNDGTSSNSSAPRSNTNTKPVKADPKEKAPPSRPANRPN